VNVRLSDEELAYWARRIGGFNPAAKVAYAHGLAVEFATKHAGKMLPSIQHGVLGHHFRILIEPDRGEKKLLRLGIDSLLELGRAINDNARS
jgi:hypothetical protein